MGPVHTGAVHSSGRVHGRGPGHGTVVAGHGGGSGAVWCQVLLLSLAAAKLVWGEGVKSH